eukprot:4380161-Prymnesium_polylepis.1
MPRRTNVLVDGRAAGPAHERGGGGELLVRVVRAGELAAPVHGQVGSEDVRSRVPRWRGRECNGRVGGGGERGPRATRHLGGRLG